MRSILPLLTAFVLAAAAAAARAATLEAGIQADVEITSAYVWRGQVINPDPCLQPALLFSTGNFSLDVWGTLDLVTDDDTWERNRIDVKGRYAWERGVQIMSAGLIAYIYHDGPRGQSKDTWEAMLGYALDVPLLPSVVLYYDIDRVDGAYATASLSHSFELYRDLAAVDMGVYLSGADPGYLNGTFDQRSRRERAEEGPLFDSAALVDFVAAAWIPVHLRPSLILTPRLAYMSLLDERLRNAARDDDREAERLFYSLAVTAFF